MMQSHYGLWILWNMDYCLHCAKFKLLLSLIQKSNIEQEMEINDAKPRTFVDLFGHVIHNFGLSCMQFWLWLILLKAFRGLNVYFVDVGSYKLDVEIS